MNVADISTRCSMLSDLAYHDYIVLICSMDAEWSRRRFPPNDQSLITEEEKKGFLKNQRDFYESCNKFKKGINENYSKFEDANRNSKNDQVADFIFNPINYFPLGDADDLSIVLLDDFDSVHRLTAEIETSVAELCIGFCPSIDSITKSTSKTLWDLDKLLQIKLEQQNNLKQYMHGFQKETPLLIFSKYKLNAMATLGHGLYFQQAIFKTMAVKIQEIIEELQQRYSDDSTLRKMVKKDDIENVKFNFIDLQGQEEIGTLCFCSNYSVGILLLSVLRSLIFSDIFEVDKNVEELLLRSKLYRSTFGNAKQPQHKGNASSAEAIRNNHLFSWTRTTLGVAPGALFNPEKYPCNGLVETISKIQISPGHRLEVEHDFKGNLENQTQVQINKSFYHRCHIGTEDLQFMYGQEERFSLMPLTSVLSLILTNVLKFRRMKRDGDHGRDIVDIVTSMTIPVPKMIKGGRDLACGQVAAGHKSYLEELLKNIHDGLFKNKPDGKRIGLKCGRLNLDELAKKHRELGVPVSLRRTIENLYQDFAIIIRDPFLFESVIDLYDAFATFHKLLTEALPKIRHRERDGFYGLGYIDEKRVIQLSMFAEALNNALMHRVSRGYPETYIREMCVDFRGSINQILLSADAAVKCGLGLVRKYSGIRAIENEEVKTSIPRDTVGCVTRIGFTPGARCYSFQFGEEQSIMLAFLDVDISHILHPASYCDNMHEAFHFAFTPPNTGPYKEIYDNMGTAMKDRVGDIFAGLLTKTILFASDTNAFIYDHIGSYSKSLISVGVDDAETVARFVDVLIRLFIIQDSVQDYQKAGFFNQFFRKRKFLTECFERFNSMIGSFGHYFSEYDRLWKGTNADSVMSLCENQFYRIYPELIQMMPYVKEQADDIIAKYKKDLCWERNSSCPFDINDKYVRECSRLGLESGRPIIRAMCGGLHIQSPECPDKTSTIGNEEAGLDSLLLVSAVLSTYISRVKMGENLAVHLIRKPDTKDIDYTLPSGYDKWYDFQFDKSAASMFCPVPSARRERIRRQIVILKTLWDVSSCLRARRLNEIIDQTCPK